MVDCVSKNSLCGVLFTHCICKLSHVTEDLLFEKFHPIFESTHHGALHTNRLFHAVNYGEGVLVFLSKII